MKPYCLVILLFFSQSAFAQYRGGGDDGFAMGIVSTLNLGLNGMYSGGMDDGHSEISSNLTLSTTSSSYSGGPDDGSSAAVVTNLPLAVGGSMYTGGNNDGHGAVITYSASLSGNSSMYAGGSDDGFAVRNSTALLLVVGGMYTGGVNDGIGAITTLATALSFSSMYNGGGNDGFNIISTNTAFSSSASMYAGGSDDGFSSTFSNVSIVPLPLSWLQFTARRDGKDAILNWTVANDNSTFGYAIERSYDGKSFIHLGEESAQSSVRTTATYSYTDYDPAAFCIGAACNVVFYRIKQLKLDGTFTFSETRKISLNPALLFPTVYPNPATNKIVVKWNEAGGSDVPYSFSLYNTTGVNAISGTGTTSITKDIDIRQLSSGAYYLRLFLEGSVHNFQITILH